MKKYIPEMFGSMDMGMKSVETIDGHSRVI